MILAGCVAPFFPVIHRYYHKPMKSQFLAPTTRQYEVVKPGSHSVWYDYVTTFNGTAYSSSSNFPPGLKITLLQVETGSFIPMETNRQAHHSTLDSASMLIGAFDITAPGRYNLSISGKADKPVVCSFEQDWVLGFLGKTFALLVGGAVSAGVGLLIIIVVFVWRRFA